MPPKKGKNSTRQVKQKNVADMPTLDDSSVEQKGLSESDEESQGEDEEGEPPKAVKPQVSKKQTGKRTVPKRKKVNNGSAKNEADNRQVSESDEEDQGADEEEEPPKAVKPKPTKKQVRKPAVESKPKQEVEVKKKEEKKNAPPKKNQPRMTVADVVRASSKRLVELQEFASLEGLKKMIASERDEDYVTRNYERIKAAIKHMFSTAEIVPINRKFVKYPLVYMRFKFSAKKPKTTKQTVAKPASKNVKTKNAKLDGKKKREDEEMPEFDDDEDVPPKHR